MGIGTRLPALLGTPVLKFGDGRVAGCDLVPLGAIQSRSASLFVLSGAVLSRLVMSWTFATCLKSEASVGRGLLSANRWRGLGS